MAHGHGVLGVSTAQSPTAIARRSYYSSGIREFCAADREAIFAIIVLSDNAIEYGFRTTDQQLINALSEMRQQYLQQQ